MCCATGVAAITLTGGAGSVIGGDGARATAGAAAGIGGNAYPASTSSACTPMSGFEAMTGEVPNSAGAGVPMGDSSIFMGGLRVRPLRAVAEALALTSVEEILAVVAEGLASS